MFNIKLEFLFIAIILVINFTLYKFNKVFAKNFNLYDIPSDKRKLHKYPTPLNGGIFYFLNLLVIFIFDIFFNELKLISIFRIENESEPILLLIIFFSILMIGIIDDKISLPPITKSLLSIIVFLIFLLMKPEYQIINLRFETFSFIFDLFKLSLIFTVLCFLILQISLNMYDGIDLQSVTYYSVIIIYLTILNENYNYLIFSILTLINLLFFAIYNYKKKTFLGDNGVYIFSFILSLLIIQTYQDNYYKINVENIFIILFLPIIDMIRLFFIRLIKNKNPLKPDRNHLHHILLKKYGLIKTNILLVSPLIFFILLMSYTNINIILILALNFSLYLYLIQNSKK
jgi:UDP-GlcNAc:undecaprenyl-phosphate GlcNAc-1-phosphate transferase|tara:strand:- start:826 stop:1857 length:1032 start_codon:yes stop_codon:yes gene_type:complete